ncbi:MAG: hypothetical protein KBA97_11215 [Methanothrix sp.]|nr:hypothetical protein [Methanothrix sp.]
MFLSGNAFYFILVSFVVPHSILSPATTAWWCGAIHALPAPADLISRPEQERTLLTRRIEATDRQIDRLVYELSSLTEEEIGLVEGGTDEWLLEEHFPKIANPELKEAAKAAGQGNQARSGQAAEPSESAPQTQPGFGSIFAIAGLIAVASVLRQRN